MADENEHDISALLASTSSPSIPARVANDLTCCCGRRDCAYLLHNNAALDGLERNLHTAAQLGQVRILGLFACLVFRPCTSKRCLQ